MTAFTYWFLTFGPCNVKITSKFLKRSANDEKWRDCFLFVTSIKISASGEVEVSQNMAEYIWKWKVTFVKLQRVSDLDIESQNRSPQVTSTTNTKAEEKREYDW